MIGTNKKQHRLGALKSAYVCKQRDASRKLRSIWAWRNTGKSLEHDRSMTNWAQSPEDKFITLKLNCSYMCITKRKSSRSSGPLVWLLFGMHIGQSFFNRQMMVAIFVVTKMMKQFIVTIHHRMNTINDRVSMAIQSQSVAFQLLNNKESL